MVDDYVYFKGSKQYYCKKHNILFLEGSNCSKCLTSVSDGKSENQKSGVAFEQGVEQGVGIVYKDVFCTGMDFCIVRSHAFRWVVKVDSSIGNQGYLNRVKILKDKGYFAERKPGIGRVIMTRINGFKVWLADHSIVIYFPRIKEYYVNAARLGYNYAVNDLLDLLLKIEEILGVSLRLNGSYRFKASGQHHALINNTLAKQYTRNNEQLQVINKDGELWLLIDNSKPFGVGLNELETVHKDSAVSDNEIVQAFFNDIKHNPFYKLSDLKRMFDIVLNVQVEYSEQIKKHLVIQDKTLDTLNKMDYSLLKLSSAIASSPQTFDSVPAQSRKFKARKLLDEWGW